LKLTVKAVLEVLLDLEPRQLNLGLTPRGEASSRTVKLSGPEAAGTDIVSVTYQNTRRSRTQPVARRPIVIARLPEGDRADTIELTVAPDAPSGPFYGRLLVATDHPKATQLSLAVQGTVRPAIRVRPRSLVFRTAGEGVSQTRTVTVGGAGEVAAELLGVELDHPALEASVVPPDPRNGRAKIAVTWNGKLDGDREKATMILRTSHPQEPTVEVPVLLERAAPAGVPGSDQ